MSEKRRQVVYGCSPLCSVARYCRRSLVYVVGRLGVTMVHDVVWLGRKK